MPGDPKDSQTIRKALDAIRSGANITTPVGPHANGMSPDHPVLIAAFVDPEVARTFQRMLIEQGIEPSSENSGGRYKVLVDAVDARQATGIYLARRKDLKDGKTSRNPGRYDYLIFSAVVGVTLCLIFFIVVGNGTKQDPKDQLKAWLLATKAAFLFLAMCLVTGHLADRIRMKKFKGPKLKGSIDVWELLLLFTYPIMIYVFFGTIEALMKYITVL